MAQNNPVLVEVTRGGGVECRHRGAVAVADAAGTIVSAWGDVARPVFPRSAIKPLQALPLIETGAADRYALEQRELALACASHAGEAAHVETAAGWLARIGLGPEALECGAHAPSGPLAAAALVRAGRAPSALHNNCSGKHAGFLTTARHLGEETAGYVDPDHPVQRRLARLLGDMGAIDLDRAPHGTDGCAIPTIAMPLTALARAMAGLAAPEGLSPERAAAARRIVGAMTAEPAMVSGSGRFDTLVMAAGGGALVTKTGAEGVYAAVLPGRGLGIVLKIDDGAKRASQAAMAAVLLHIGGLEDRVRRVLETFAEQPVANVRGDHVGVIAPTRGWPA